MIMIVIMMYIPQDNYGILNYNTKIDNSIIIRKKK